MAVRSCWQSAAGQAPPEAACSAPATAAAAPAAPGLGGPGRELSSSVRLRAYQVTRPLLALQAVRAMMADSTHLPMAVSVNNLQQQATLVTQP